MTLSSGAKAFRVALSLTVLAWTILSCVGGGGTPPPDGPPFVVNSPRDGGRVAGTVFFSAQPFDPAEVDSVAFEADGVDLGTDSDGSDGFRVFLNARDLPAGTVRLTATARGHNGATSSRSVTVEAVPSPPSSATVGRDGAVLGTTEANGAVSTLVVPAGAPEGADVTFEARTEDEVLAATGVDYDALGVTFLGAQEVASSAALGTPVAVASGGFGPMVQPGQIVVNYTILPDADGDGVGELMVVNGASVTPDGDVISDPVPGVQLGGATVTNASGSASLRSVQDETVRGPPGTFVEIEATGFNAWSIHGTVALFTSQVDGSEIELPAFVDHHYEDEDAHPTVGFYIPPLPEGGATVVLRNVGTDETVGPIALIIEASSELGGTPSAVIEEILTEVITTLSTVAEVADGIEPLEKARLQIAEMRATATPEEEEALREVAEFMNDSNVRELLARVVPGASGAPGASDCSYATIASFAAIGAIGAVGMAASLLLMGTFMPLAVGAGFVLAAGSSFVAGAGTMGTLLAVRDCIELPPPPPCLPPYKSTDLAPWLGGSDPAPSPDRRAAQQTPPPPTTTGMGSAFPPGGDACGSALGAPGAPDGALRSQQTGVGDLLGDLTGRYLVRIFYGGGATVPFVGISDASGYFYVPLVPAGQPFEALAIDTVTGETRSVEGIGPAVGSSTYLFFDFFGESDDADPVIELDTNTTGEYGDVDRYLFEGAAGELITLAIFSEQPPQELVTYSLTGPDGVIVGEVSFAGAGTHLFDEGVLQLRLDGFHTLVIDGSAAAGGYTLGLARVQPPTPVTAPGTVAGELATLGERHFYVISGEAGQTLDFGLAHGGDSALHGELLVREYLDGTDFYAAPRRRSVTTTADDRSRSSFYPLPGDGEYVFEVGPWDIVTDALENHLGGYQVSFELSD